MGSIQHEGRNDWHTAQVVDAMINYLTAGGKVGFAKNCMDMHLVPISVQKRVMNHTAVIRHRSLTAASQGFS